MASTNDVIFPESMADILANPVDICFCSRSITLHESQDQIEYGLNSQDHGSHGNHLDEPCPTHEKSKHTARQCCVLKKFRRPLTATHRRRLNQESSPDRLAFQVAHTTISSNYPGEEFETLDRQILAVSADVPPQDGETDEQRQEHENTNAARAVRRQQEPAAAAPAAGHQVANISQVNANVGQQALVAPAAPQ
jgi:hypothetical protein